jgi:hypothetical protein
MNFWEILIAFAVVLIVACVLSNKKKEHFNPYNDYTRAYPALFAYKPGYGPYYEPDTLYGRNIRYSPGYRDYYYIPGHDYMNNWMNGIPREEAVNAMAYRQGLYPAQSYPWFIKQDVFEDEQEIYPSDDTFVPDYDKARIIPYPIPASISEYCAGNNLDPGANCIVPMSVPESFVL